MIANSTAAYNNLMSTLTCSYNRKPFSKTIVFLPCSHRFNTQYVKILDLYQKALTHCPVCKKEICHYCLDEDISIISQILLEPSHNKILFLLALKVRNQLICLKPIGENLILIKKAEKLWDALHDWQTGKIFSFPFIIYPCGHKVDQATARSIFYKTITKKDSANKVDAFKKKCPLCLRTIKVLYKDDTFKDFLSLLLSYLKKTYSEERIKMTPKFQAVESIPNPAEMA